MKKNLAVLEILLFISCGVLPAVHFVFAEDTLIEKNLKGVGTGLGDMSTGEVLPQRIGAILKVTVGVLGVVLTCLIIYGGFLWMTAGGDPGQVKKAKAYITDAIIGLIICILAYAITTFVIDKLTGAITQ
ncbi:hypothetical protein HY932_02185 [Candidatus Falkowbacteria bacterium]|nr:hypothetical protein [Candidatus Falkowbacteria bacterium]